MHGCSTGSVTTPGHSRFELYRRLADTGTIARDSAPTQRHRVSSCGFSRAETQHQQECSFSCPENDLSRDRLGFDHDAGTTVSRSDRNHSADHEQGQARPRALCSSVPEDARSYGISIHGDPSGAVAHETVSVVAKSQRVSSKSQSSKANKSDAPRASYTISVAQTPVPHLGSHSRGAVSSQTANDRRLPGRLGSGLGRPSSSREMGGPSARLAHQLPRADGCISGSEIFSPPIERLSCLGAGGQYSGSLLFKSPGRSALTQPEQNSEADFSLGPGQVPVTQGSIHSRAVECGSRFTVQTDTTDGGMETPPGGSETDLDQILRSGGGPLRLPADCAMSPLLLSESPSSVGSGCDGALMAQYAPVCVSPSLSAPGSSSQGSPTRVLPLADSAALAEQSMVLGDNISPRRLAVGDSGEEGPSVSGGGNDIPSQARSVESSRLAPEGNQLRDTGLSPAVIETILSARAPSTRKNYAAKWGVFERWCVKHNVDPVNCQIASVLDFMQEKLSTGTCPATLRGYVAALSACHALIDGAPLGSHPLLSRFLRGARRLRPPVKTKIPSWDLAIVLEGLVGTPFEPLESASDKLLTLKMVFLMAITSLKRIGDMQALSISPSCLDFAPGMVKVILHPHPDYLPKVPFSAAHPVILEAFCPPPFITPEQEKSHRLCPVRVLQAYVHRTSQWRKSEQLFVCYGVHNRGAAATKQTMSHWVRDAIALAYEARSQAPPIGLRAHSTRGVASSSALARGAPLQQAFLRSCETHLHSRGGPDMLKHGGVGILVPNALSSAASTEAFEGNDPGYLTVTVFPEKAERDAALFCRAEDVPGLLFRQNILMMHLWVIYL
ncbi:Non-reducing polyketide synthase PKS8-1 [Labeo rohita]|uniref:Non-reducing polyketide synthase PKS8-1 n=1 Tax=Labeo rohita TaxID=84645 RepID=A0ABQ8MXX0_LABRO|nr:Non-reducing polyketide synthase PKS8-1 [Labeo rohita]